MKIARALATSWVAVTLLAIFEMLWVLVVEQAQPVGYFALGSGLMLLSATLVAIGLAFTQDPSPWIASALAGLAAGLVWSPLHGMAAALAIALLLWLDRRGRVRASTYGVAVAAGLGLSAIVAPRLLTRVPVVSSLSPSGQEAVLVTFLVLAVVGLVGIQSRLYQSPIGRIATPLAALALLSCSALPFLTRGPRPPEVSPQPVRASAPLERPHVVLLVLDTVRADHMTLYGYEKPTTPRLEGILRARPEAAIFPSAYANSNWTVPSHASLFTGLLPSEHGAHFGSGSRNQFSLRDHPTLAEAMRAAGYRTIGIYANPWLGHVEGMDRGFDVYRSPRGGVPAAPLRRVPPATLGPRALSGGDPCRAPRRRDQRCGRGGAPRLW